MSTEMPRRYDFLICLRENGGKLPASRLAAMMDCSVVTVWANYQPLHKEGLLQRSKRTVCSILVTAAGWEWNPPKPEQSTDLPLWPCGHPIVASTPDFCMTCRNEQRRAEFKSGTRYFMWTMKQAKVAT